MKAKVLFGMFLIMSTLLWSCIDVVLNSEEGMNPPETNLITEEHNLKSGTLGKEISLLLKNEEAVGTMTISNNATTLTVKIAGNSEYNLEEVQLWVGTIPCEVPSNRVNKPIPGRFPYKSSGKSAYQFEILLEEIIPDFELTEGNDIYLFTHAKAINKYTGIDESAWSEGEYLPANTQFSVTYSTYTPIGGGGCFPHFAFCGEFIDNNYYYSINEESENIVADNGEVIGSAFLSEGKIYFDFDQGWMFSGETPEVKVTGYADTKTAGIDIFSGSPDFDNSQFLYFVPVYDINLYQVELQLQFCTTDNNYQW